MWLRCGFVSPLHIIFEIDMDDLAWTNELLVHYQCTSWHCLCEMVFDDVGPNHVPIHALHLCTLAGTKPALQCTGQYATLAMLYMQQYENWHAWVLLGLWAKLGLPLF